MCQLQSLFTNSKKEDNANLPYLIITPHHVDVLMDERQANPWPERRFKSPSDTAFYVNNMNFLDFKAPRHRKNQAVSVGKSELNLPTFFKVTKPYINGSTDEVSWC